MCCQGVYILDKTSTYCLHRTTCHTRPEVISQNTVAIFFYYTKGLAILVCLGQAGRAEQYSTKIPDNLLLLHLLLRIQIPYVKI